MNKEKEIVKSVDGNVQVINQAVDNIRIEDVIESDLAVMQIVKNIKKYEKEVNEIEIKDESTNICGATLYNLLRGFEKELDERRKEYVEPFNRIVKRANEKIKAITTMIGKIRFALGLKMTAYQQKLEELKRKEEEKHRKKVEEALKKDKPIPVAKTVIVENKVKTDTGKVVYKEIWRANIIDLQKFLKWILDNNQLNAIEVKQSELNKIANFYKDTKEIPGLKIVSEKQISSYS